MDSAYNPKQHYNDNQLYSQGNQTQHYDNCLNYQGNQTHHNGNHLNYQVNQTHHNDNHLNYQGNQPHNQENRTYNGSSNQGNQIYYHGMQGNYQEYQQNQWNQYNQPRYPNDQENNGTPRYPMERYPPSANTPPYTRKYENYPGRGTSQTKNSKKCNKKSIGKSENGGKGNHSQPEVNLYFYIL